MFWGARGIWQQESEISTHCRVEQEHCLAAKDTAPALGFEGQETDLLPTAQAAAMAGTHCHLLIPSPTGASRHGTTGPHHPELPSQEPAQASLGAGSTAGSLSLAQHCPQAALLPSARKSETCNEDVRDLGKPILRSLGRARAPFSLWRGSGSRWKHLLGRIFKPTPFLPCGEVCRQRGDAAADPTYWHGTSLSPSSCGAGSGTERLPGTCSVRIPLPR